MRSRSCALDLCLGRPALRGFAAFVAVRLTPTGADIAGVAHGLSLRCLTFELSGCRPQDARPGLAKMFRVPPDWAWWPAVGAPLERGVRRRRADFHDGLQNLGCGFLGLVGGPATTSQCSTIMPLCRRKTSAIAYAGAPGAGTKRACKKTKSSSAIVRITSQVAAGSLSINSARKAAEPSRVGSAMSGLCSMKPGVMNRSNACFGRLPCSPRR